MKLPDERRAAAVALLACDAMLLLWALATALAVRYGISGWPGGTETTRGGLVALALTPAGALAFMAVGGLYRVDELFSGHREYAAVVRACTYAVFLLVLIAFLTDMRVARGALVITWALSWTSVACGRFAFRRAVFRLRRSGRLIRRAIIAGADEHGIAVARRLSDPATGWRVLGFLDDYQPPGTPVLPGLEVLGDPRAAFEAARACGATDIIVVPHAVSWESQRDLLEASATRQEPAVRIAPGLHDLLAAGARPMEANYVPLLSLQRLRITGVDATLKQAMDYGLSLTALPALALLTGALWLASRLSGPSELFAKEPALGLHQKPFQLLLVAPPKEARRNTRLGRWAHGVRSVVAGGRLAKLPGVINVLRGQMSLIGPRALSPSPALTGQAWARTLLLVRPGITGPKPPDGRWSAEEQALLDVTYVRDHSFWLDLRILLSALRRALRREPPLPASYQAASSNEPAGVEQPAA
jgi:lipopolysaccharide/colanic/teichoic acid biosynthesis glycosyltransferase